MKRYLLGFMVLVGTLLTPALSATPLTYLQGLNQPDYLELRSGLLDRGFHIYIRLPEGYEDNQRSYPTVYLLDGGHTFGMLASYYRYLNFAAEVPDMIIVGISYGTDNFEEGNFRSSDFTAKAGSRAHYGGAETFQAFLAKELMPTIEENYRSNPALRIIFGQSLGGQFVLFTAQTAPELFWGHIASNPALHRNLEFFMANHTDSKPSSSHLFVSSGDHDDERFRGPAVQWMEHWNKADKKPWRLKTVSLEGESHFSAAPQAFRQGIRWFFTQN